MAGEGQAGGRLEGGTGPGEGAGRGSPGAQLRGSPGAGRAWPGSRTPLHPGPPTLPRLRTLGPRPRASRPAHVPRRRPPPGAPPARPTMRQRPACAWTLSRPLPQRTVAATGRPARPAAPSWRPCTPLIRPGRRVPSRLSDVLASCGNARETSQVMSQTTQAKLSMGHTGGQGNE